MPDALFGIYIHWPFCKAKCPYCDFNSHVSNAIDHEKWAQAYCREIDHVAAMTKGRQVTSIFFGGGTPSLMQPQTVEKVIDHLVENRIRGILNYAPVAPQVPKGIVMMNIDPVLSLQSMTFYLRHLL